MKHVRWRLPSPGFLLILLTWVATAGLFAWGLREPELHRTWDLMARMEQEDAHPPTAEEIAAVGRVLQAHPEWATTIAAGRPFAVLEAPQTGCLRFDTSYLMIPASAGEVRLQLRCHGIGANGLDVSIEAGDAPVACHCSPQGQPRRLLRLPGAGHARLVPVRRSPGPHFRDDRTCPVFLVPLDEDIDTIQPEKEPSQEGDDAAKD